MSVSSGLVPEIHGLWSTLFVNGLCFVKLRITPLLMILLYDLPWCFLPQVSFMFAVDHRLRVNLSGEVNCTITLKREGRLLTYFQSAYASNGDAIFSSRCCHRSGCTVFEGSTCSCGQGMLLLRHFLVFSCENFGMPVNACIDQVMIIMEGRVEVRLPKKTFNGPLLHILKKG